jgi:hypothetical protein
MRTKLSRRLQMIDSAITGWMARFGPELLRISLGIVFLWFGVLKFFPNVSPAQELATRTIGVLTGGLIPDSVSVATSGGVGVRDRDRTATQPRTPWDSLAPLCADARYDDADRPIPA